MSAGSLNLIADVIILAGASTSLIVSIDQQLRQAGRCFRGRHLPGGRQLQLFYRFDDLRDVR
jgi:hypothetical protein